MTRRSFLAALSLASGTLFSGWRPDGLGYRARIGLLTPNDDAVPESEFWTMAPEGVSVHLSRVQLVDTRTFSDPPHPDDATALLAALPMQAIVFAFTTTSYVLGPDGEQALIASSSALLNAPFHSHLLQQTSISGLGSSASR